MIAKLKSPLSHARGQRRRGAAIALAIAGLGLSCWLALSPLLAHAAPSKPNVILIVTDDQSLDEISAMPRTNSLIGGQGVTFKNGFISYPLCCPSRSTILTGQYMHNSGVRGNGYPDGGWQRFADNGLEQKDLPNWTRAAGYYNVLVGKYLNGYGVSDPQTPQAWDEWYGKISEYDESVYGAAIYFNYRMREDPPAVGGVPCPSGDPEPPGEPFTCLYGQDPSDYQTDVFRDKAVEAIHRLSAGASPFFMSVDFNSPHSPYVPAPRHAGLYANANLPRIGGQNEADVRDKPRFLRRLPKLGKGKLSLIDSRRRSRLEMLLSVDDGVSAMVQALQDEGQLDNTYIIFISDNGYFEGEHRIRQGKYLPHEPSSHVPFMMRGPGIPAGTTSSELVSNADIAPTIAAITGATPTLTEDGRSLLPFAQSPTQRSARPLVLEGDTGQGIDDEGGEGPGLGTDPGDAARVKAFHKKLKRKKRKLKKRCKRLHKKRPARALICFKRGVSNIDQEPTDKTYKLKAPAYTGLRTERYALYLYSTGEIELYDMLRDRKQVSSLQKNPRYAKVMKYLLAQLGSFRSCTGAACNGDIGAIPKPLKKSQLRKQHRKQKHRKQKQKQRKQKQGKKKPAAA
jgi:N-acetylglucosamine-6-sulfatase